MEVIVTGGRQKRSALQKPEWFQFECGLVLKIDLENMVVKDVLEYVSPSDVLPDLESSVLFKAGSIYNRNIYCCTQTEVVILNLSDLSIIDTHSLPCFNDLHHVLPINEDSIYVVNTGLDAIVEINRNGNEVNTWSVIGENTWKNYSRDIDYRKIPSTKPHKSHPNHIVNLDDNLWVTRFGQRDAICINDLSANRLKIDIGKPHDGLYYNNRIHFTTVDGFIVSYNGVTQESRTVIKLLHEDDEVLGWCRGLCMEGEDYWVGFSRIRATKLLENLSWIKHGFKKVGQYASKPTRIAKYSSKGELQQQIDLEPYGMNAVFSILPVDSK